MEVEDQNASLDDENPVRENCVDDVVVEVKGDEGTLKQPHLTSGDGGSYLREQLVTKEENTDHNEPFGRRERGPESITHISSEEETDFPHKSQSELSKKDADSPIITEEDAKHAVIVCDPSFIDVATEDSSCAKEDSGTECEGVDSSVALLSSSDAESLTTSESIKLDKQEDDDIDKAMGFSHNLRGSTLMTRLSKSVENDHVDVGVLNPRDAVATTNRDMDEVTLSVSRNSPPKGKQTRSSLRDPDQKALGDYNNGSLLSDSANLYGVPAAVLSSKLQSKLGKPSGKSDKDFEKVNESACEAQEEISQQTAYTRNSISYKTVSTRLKRKIETLPITGLQFASKRGKPDDNMSNSLENKTSTQTRGKGDNKKFCEEKQESMESVERGKIMKGVSWTPDVMKNALRDIKDGMTIGKASEIYLIPASTLRSRISRKKGRSGQSKRAVAWTEEAMKGALRAVEEGMSIKEASLVYQIPPSTIYDRTRHTGTKKGTRASVSWTEEMMCKAVEHVCKGQSFSSASAKFGIPPTTIRDRFKLLDQQPTRRKTRPKPKHKVNSVRLFKGGERATRHVGRHKHLASVTEKSNMHNSNTPHERGEQSDSSILKAREIVKSARLFEQGRPRRPTTRRSANNGCTWTEDDMAKAMKELEVGMKPIKAAKRHGLSDKNFRLRKERKNRVRMYNRTSSRQVKGQSGRQYEDQLAQYISKLNSVGFIPTNDDELMKMAEDFIVAKHSDSVLNAPALDRIWLNNFLQRNSHGRKMVRMMKSHKEVEFSGSSPFLIYSFYDALEQVNSQKSLESNQVWACCEFSFPNDSEGVDQRLQFDANPECAKTCLISCCGGGDFLDPFIIHNGSVDHSTIRSHMSLPGTSHVASESGSITASIFDTWFESFCVAITRRPLLVIVDSKVTYLSVQTVEKAVSENIFLMKLPCNTSSVLQPLWQFCIDELECQWKLSLTEWQNNHRDKAMTDGQFTEKLCAIWSKCLSPENIIAGFKSTGIFPVNRSQFPTDKLDKGLVRLHTVWLAAGKPQHMAPDIPSFFNPQFEKLQVTFPSRRATRPAKQPVPLDMTDGSDIIDDDYSSNRPFVAVNQSPSHSDSTSNSYLPVCWCRKPPPAVPGKKWVPTWTLLDDNTSISNSTPC